VSQIYELFLRVREADEADHGRSVIRLHKTEKPKGLRWGDKINISLDKKNWVNCKLEPAGDIGTGKIYISIHLRGLINKDTRVTSIAKVGEPCNFYVRKASPWRALLYIAVGILLIAAIAITVSLLLR
jgi:hypothetical protein